MLIDSATDEKIGKREADQGCNLLKKTEVILLRRFASIIVFTCDCDQVKL